MKVGGLGKGFIYLDRIERAPSLLVYPFIILLNTTTQNKKTNGQMKERSSLL